MAKYFILTKLNLTTTKQKYASNSQPVDFTPKQQPQQQLDPMSNMGPPQGPDMMMNQVRNKP